MSQGRLMPEDVCGSDNTGRIWTDEQVKEMWPQAKSELLGFANALERGSAGITASQLRMAVQLAQKRFEEMT